MADPTIDNLRLLLRDDDENVFTDEQLTAAIVAAPDSLLRAAGVACQSLALEYATLGKSIKTDDLAIDTKSRGADLLAVARSFFAEADAADASFFQIVPLAPTAATGVVRPEATPWPVL